MLPLPPQTALYNKILDFKAEMCYHSINSQTHWRAEYEKPELQKLRRSDGH